MSIIRRNAHWVFSQRVKEKSVDQQPVSPLFPFTKRVAVLLIMKSFLFLTDGGVPIPRLVASFPSFSPFLRHREQGERLTGKNDNISIFFFTPKNVGFPPVFLFFLYQIYRYVRLLPPDATDVNFFLSIPSELIGHLCEGGGSNTTPVFFLYSK